MPHRVIRAAVCVLALAVALPSAGAAAAPSASTSLSAAAPAATLVTRVTPQPKPKKKPSPTSLASRLRNRRPVTRRGRAAAAAAARDPRLAVAAIPSIGRLSLDIQPGATLAEWSAIPAAPATTLLESVLSRARSQLGTRYVLGGDDPGSALDCSSFARYAMEALGITLPRTAAQQAQVGDSVPRDRTMLRPGDLLTFGTRKKVSHVGIYLGEGRFIHASVTSGRIIETTIERNTRLFRRWLGARRILATGDTSAARRDG